MHRVTRSLIIVAVALSALTPSALLGAEEPERFFVYDLRPALRYDARDRWQVADAWDHVHAVATIQGIVNRDAPRLFIRYIEAHGRNIDDYWLQHLSAPGQWLAGRPRRPLGSLPALLHTFRDRIHGAVVYDPAVPATSNLASTIAGVEDLVAIRYDPHPESLYSRLIEGGPKLPVGRRLLNEDGSPLFTGTGTIPGTDLPSTGSAKCDAYLWLKHHYIDSGKVDAGYAGHYIDAYWIDHPTASSPNQHTLSNHDYFVAKRGFFFDLNVWDDETPVDDRDQEPGTDKRTLLALFQSAYEQAGRERMIHIGGFTPWAYKYTTHRQAGGTHDPVPTEWELVRLASAYNGYIDADAIGFAAMANASFYMHFPLKDAYPQRWVTHDELRERGYLTADGQVNFDGREFIIFYVGDYDAAAWLYQWMPVLWESPARGKIPLMWSITPIAERRAPMVLHHLWETATPNDYFAAADNGAGYLNPGMLQEPRPVSGLPDGLEAWARHCKPFYERWGMSITGFIIDGYAPGLNERGLDCYARFSPNGIVPQKIPPALLHGEMPVLRADRDLPQGPARAADLIRERVKDRPLPFHWFRAILKGPEWYVSVVEHLEAADPTIELLDAPTYFELLRLYLQQSP